MKKGDENRLFSWHFHIVNCGCKRVYKRRNKRVRTVEKRKRNINVQRGRKRIRFLSAKH